MTSESGVEPRLLRTRISWLALYFAGVAVSCGSYLLMLRFDGNRGNGLALSMLTCSEAIRRFANLTWDPGGWPKTLPVLISGLAIGAAFPLTLFLVLSKLKGLKISGLLLSISLLVMTLYWFRISL